MSKKPGRPLSSVCSARVWNITKRKIQKEKIARKICKKIKGKKPFLESWN